MIDWLTLIMELMGGLALFLYGMEKMSSGLKLVAGQRLKTILARLASHRWLGMLTGATMTAVIQSSSITTVLLVGFVTAELMTLAQAVPIILGANIGTTITAQIIAFKVTHYALLIVAIGFGMGFLFKNETLQEYGQVVLGLGLVFFGMGLMSDAMHPLREYPPFLELMTQVSQPLWGILVAAFFTALVQSSSATTGLVIVLASQGIITLEAGIALALGANIGTCVTAGLAALGKPREAVQVALVHVIFNICGVLVFLPIISPFSDLVRSLSPTASFGVSGAAALAEVVPRQIANAHTIFNVTMAVAALPFTALLARSLERWVPKFSSKTPAVISPKYLDEAFLNTPTLALEAARQESQRMGKRVHAMLKDGFPKVLHGNLKDLETLRQKDEAVDALQGQIVTYLAKLSQTHLEKAERERLMRLTSAINNWENIGDILETDLIALGEERIAGQIEVSPASEKVLLELWEQVMQAVDRVLLAWSDQDLRQAQKALDMRHRVKQLSKRAERHQADRLASNNAERLLAYRIEIDCINGLQRIYYHLKRLAKGIR